MTTSNSCGIVLLVSQCSGVNDGIKLVVSRVVEEVETLLISRFGDKVEVLLVGRVSDKALHDSHTLVASKGSSLLENKYRYIKVCKC